MKTLHIHYVSHGLLAAGLVLAMGAGPAAAQQQQQQQANAQPPQQLEVADPAQTPQAPRPQGTADLQLEPSYWSTNGGFEADSHATGYGFFGPGYHKPISKNVMFVAGANLNYLYYEFENGLGGTTSVRSPGVSTKAGLRFGDRNWVQIKAGPSFKRKTREIGNSAGFATTDTDIEPGFSVGADVWANPTRIDNIHGMLNYGTEDGYIWSRIGYKHQITNHDWRGRFSHFLGTEYITQGNEDIRSNQVGAFVEFLHAPSTISVMVRGGYKHSSFQAGPDKTGPWFAVSFYKAYR